MSDRIDPKLPEHPGDVVRQRDALLAAIRAHRDARGDDRCWIDDLVLYAALPEGAPAPELLALHTPEEMLANCRRYLASRQPDTVPYVSPQREIERLRKVAWGLVHNAHRVHPGGTTVAGMVADRAGLGSTTAAALCREFGVDPDREVARLQTVEEEL